MLLQTKCIENLANLKGKPDQLAISDGSQIRQLGKLGDTYHHTFFSFGNFWAEFQVRGDCHGLLNGQVSMQLIVLHNVSAQLTELADVALFAIHLDGSIFDVCGSVERNVRKLIWDRHIDLTFELTK